MNNVTLAAPENFAIELVRRGLPVDYSERVAQELADHKRDVLDELRATGLDEAETRAEASRRLGDERALVKKTMREFQRRHWYGRWPLLAFLLGPPVLAIMSFVAIVLLAYAIFIPLEFLGIRFNQSAPDGIVSSGEYAASLVGRVLTLFVGPAVSLMVLGYLARKAAVGSAWLCLSTVILTFFVSCMWCGLAGGVRPSFPADQGLMMVGVPVLHIGHDPMYVGQCLLPIAIGAATMLRMRRQWRHNERLILEVAKHGGPMNSPSALEGVARQLVKRGLPVGYAEHAAAELVDHYHDLQTQLRAAGLGVEAASAEALRRLGDSCTLVRKTVREYQRRHWCGRWPLFSFVLAPIPALCLFWAVMAAGLASVGWLYRSLGIELTQVDGKTSLFERALVESMWGVDFLLGPILVTALFAWLARR